MSCNYPIPCWYKHELNESGKRGLTFNGRDRYYGLDPKYKDPLSVPCGKCAGCKTDQSLMWSIRSYHEASLHDQNCFVTLTYDDAHLPSDQKISKEHLQKFFRRLRKAGHRFRYVASGEYGGLSNRPHYHAIIFGKDWLEGAIDLNGTLYTHPELVRIWGQGHVSVAPVEMGAICYVCGYVTKKMDDEDTFSLRSSKPGIGHAWLDLYKDDILRNGTVSIEGREYQVPKRYLLWYEELFQDIKASRAEHAKNSAKDVDPIVGRRHRDSREINKKSRIKARLTKEKV